MGRTISIRFGRSPAAQKEAHKIMSAVRSVYLSKEKAKRCKAGGKKMEEIVLGAGMSVVVSPLGRLEFVVLDENDKPVRAFSDELDEGWKEKLLEVLNRHGA